MTGQKQIIEALKTNGFEAVTAKGGFFIRGQGFVSYSAAKKLAGLSGRLTERAAPQERVSAFGDWAIVAMMNGG